MAIRPITGHLREDEPFPQYPIFAPLLSSTSTTMDSTFVTASRESEALQRTGTTAMIFVVSLFGVSHPTFWLSFRARQV